VNYITDDGYAVRRNGGSDHQIAPSKRVNIHTERNSKGVFDGRLFTSGCREEEAPSLKNIFIDIGAASKGSRTMGVHRVRYYVEDELMELKHWLVGRALDNRMGVI
jgi:putative aminopeptidase FrvX